VAKTGYTRPHTVHCMPGDNVVLSMLGDAEGNGAGGFAVIDAKTFEVKGRWENGGETPRLNYDFWYQPRKNVLISAIPLSVVELPKGKENSGFRAAGVACGIKRRNPAQSSAPLDLAAIAPATSGRGSRTCIPPYPRASGQRRLPP